MDPIDNLKTLLDENLGLNGQTTSWTADTRLLGAVPEIDSLAIVTIVAAIEKTFQIFLEDDDITADNFQTLGTLSELIKRKFE